MARNPFHALRLWLSAPGDDATAASFPVPHAWTIPKGEPNPGEDLFLAASREFEEETGLKPRPPFVALKPIQQKGGKIVHAWAFEGDCDPETIKSNSFTMEWPPKSGKQAQFPEIDRAEFFDLDMARIKIKARQDGLVDELEAIL